MLNRRWQWLAVFFCWSLAGQASAQVGLFIWRNSSIGGGGFCMDIRFAPAGFFNLFNEQSLYLATDVSGVYRSYGIAGDGKITNWSLLHDEASATPEEVLPRYTTALGFTLQHNFTSNHRLIAGTTEGIFLWKNQNYDWQAADMPDRSSLPAGYTMAYRDGAYPYIGIMREYSASTNYLCAGIGSIRHVVTNQTNTFGLTSVLRSLDGGATWEFTPLDNFETKKEVVHDIDYFKYSGSSDIYTFLTTDSAIYFSEDLFSAGTGQDVYFRHFNVKNASGDERAHLRGLVVLANAQPATSDSVYLFVSLHCFTDQNVGGVYWGRTRISDLTNGTEPAWQKMAAEEAADCKNIGRIIAKPGSIMSSYELYAGKYNTGYLAVANHVDREWRKITGIANNMDNAYREGNTHLRFGSMDINPADTLAHPAIYGCWNYGPQWALGKNYTAAYDAMRTYRQTFTDEQSSPPPDQDRKFYKSRGMDEIFFTGQRVTFRPQNADTMMIGCGDNHLLRSVDRGASWSSRFLRGDDDWQADHGALQQYVYHVAYHPDTTKIVLASAGSAHLGSNTNKGELLINTKYGNGDGLSWSKLAGGINDNDDHALPNGEIHAFTFDKRNPKKGVFVAVRYAGLFYAQVNVDGTLQSDFQQILDTDLTAKIPATSGVWNNFSRLEFDPYDNDVLYLSRYAPGGGVFRITLGFDQTTQSRYAPSSSNFITSVEEVITGAYNGVPEERRPINANRAFDVINLLITKDHVYAGMTCGNSLDKDGTNYCGGLIRWAKADEPQDYEWLIGGPSGTPSKTIAIGGLAQDPLYPDTIFAVTHRFTLAEKRAQDGLEAGEENYKPMNIWRSTDNGNSFSALPYWVTEHRFPEAITMSFFPDSPDSMIMPTHGNGIWIGWRYDGPPYFGEGKTNFSESAQAHLPKQFALHANYPNPFNPTTVIKYDLPRDTEVKLEIFDLLGQRVRLLLDHDMPAGYQAVSWDGKNDHGIALPSGIYLYRLRTPYFTKVRKMTLLQ